MVALIIAILVISIVVLVVYNLSISRKLTSWKNFKDKLVNNIEVVQDFITTIGDGEPTDEKLRRINEVVIEKYNIKYSTIVVFNGAEYVIKASNVDRKHYDALTNLHTEELFQDSVASAIPKYVTIEKEGEKLPYQKTEFGRAKSAMFFPLYIDNVYIGYWILESGKMHAFDDLDTTVIEGIKDNIISTLKAISYQDTIENIVRKDLFTGLNSAEYPYGQAKNIIDSQTSSAVCMFRITNIEKINETISRNMGNQIIIETSNAVKEKMYSKYIFVRYMGPKFAIVFTGVEVNSLDEFLEDLKEEIESIVLEEEIEEPEESKKKSSKATTKKKVKKNTRVASPKVNFVVTTYYKGTPIENVTKKLEEYLDNAPKSENQINYI